MTFSFPLSHLLFIMRSWTERSFHFREKKCVLWNVSKEKRSVKTSWHRPSIGVARSGLRDGNYFQVTWPLHFVPMAVTDNDLLLKWRHELVWEAQYIQAAWSAKLRRLCSNQTNAGKTGRGSHPNTWSQLQTKEKGTQIIKRQHPHISRIIDGISAVG